MFRNKIISAYLTSILGVFSGLLTNLWFLKALTQQVDATDFGLYSYIFQISSYLLILQLGMDFSVSRQIAEYIGKGETDKANSAFWELKRFNRIGATVLLIAVLILTFCFYMGIGVEYEKKEIAITLVLLVGLNQLLIFFQRPFSAALIGGHFQEVVNITTVIRTLFTTVIAYFLLINGSGVYSTPIAEIGTQLAANGVLTVLCTKKLKWKKNKPNVRDYSIFKSLLHFGLFSTVGGLAWTIEATSDILLIKFELGSLVLLSLYVVWWRFPQMLFDLATRLASSAIPTFASRHGANDGSVTATFTKLFLVVVFFASISVIGITFWLPSFINLWFPKEYFYFQPHYLALGMGTLVALRIIGNLFASFLLSAGNTKLTTRVAWFQAIVKILLAFIAIKFWGLVGLLVASCFAASLQILFYGYHLLQKQTITVSIVKNMSAIFLLAFLLAFYIRMSFASTILELIIGASVTFFVWGIIYTSICFLNNEYKPVIQNFLRQLNFVKKREF